MQVIFIQLHGQVKHAKTPSLDRYQIFKKAPTNLPSVHFFPVPEELQT